MAYEKQSVACSEPPAMKAKVFTTCSGGCQGEFQRAEGMQYFCTGPCHLIYCPSCVYSKGSPCMDCDWFICFKCWDLNEMDCFNCSTPQPIPHAETKQTLVDASTRMGAPNDYNTIASVSKSLAVSDECHIRDENEGYKRSKLDCTGIEGWGGATFWT